MNENKIALVAQRFARRWERQGLQEGGEPGVLVRGKAHRNNDRIVNAASTAHPSPDPNMSPSK